MAVKKIQIRRGASQEWEDANPVLSDGEFGLEYCSDGSKKLKLGDGAFPWKELSYFIDKQYLLDLIAEVSNTEQDEKINDLDILTKSLGNNISGIYEVLTINANTISTLLDSDSSQDSRLDNLENDSQDLTSDVESINNRVSTIESQNITTRLSSVEAKNAAQDSTLLSINNKDDQQDSKIASIETAVITATGSISGFQYTVDSLSNRTVSLESDQGTLFNNISQLQNKNSEQDGQISTINLKNVEQDNGISGLLSGLQDEAATRENADDDLQAQISSISGNLETETSDRIDSDADLQNQLDSINGNLETETSDRIENNNDLQNQIDFISGNLETETDDRIDSDSGLQNQINSISGNLETETSDRIDSDSGLQNQINSISGNLETEIGDRIIGISGAISESKEYADGLVLATQTWLSAVETVADLPTNPGSGTYLCRVKSGADYGVYQWIGTEANPSWTYFSDNLDFIDKISNPTAGNLPVIEFGGELEDSGVNLSGIIQDIDNKEAAIISGLDTQYWRGDKSWQTLDKSAVGLSNVDNTSDVDKPISTAVSGALEEREPAKHIAADEDSALAYSNANSGVLTFYPEA